MTTKGAAAVADHDPERIDPISAIPFAGFHLAAIIGMFLVGARAEWLAWCAVSYVIRIWSVTAGYHRYFSHRSFKTSRAFQFFLGFMSTLAMERGPLWWAAHHRHHHRHADREPDIHSPKISSFFHAHMGWIFREKNKRTKIEQVRDLAVYPELRLLDRFYLVPPVIAGTLLWSYAGPELFLWAGLVPTVLQWHAVFTSNSICHIWGRRRFNTRDTSRNNAFCAFVLLGEGWHNNHHFYPSAARQGFFWWEFDPVYYSLKLLEKLGIVWEVRGVPKRVLETGRRSTHPDAVTP